MEFVKVKFLKDIGKYKKDDLGFLAQPLFLKLKQKRIVGEYTHYVKEYKVKSKKIK